MEQTFMTIHNLSPDATILFASESIADILGYQPSEMHGKSAFDYFHPEEVPSARSVHSRGILLDKAAVLHYARLLSREGRWIGCECCFTIVHDVLVACTSIYRRNAKSERRAIEAPQIRRIFACSPRDPRYHMLEHLSPKFKMPPMEREPRAALILNRFTRNLTIMFATTSISTIVGLSPHELKSKSFYRCIQESCLPEAIRCLESAKANDSIAYLRFSFQDPREEDDASDAMSDDSQENYGGDEDDDEDMADDGAADERRSKRPRVEDEEPEAIAGPSIRSSSLIPIKLEEEDDKQISLPDLPDAYHAPGPGSSTASASASASTSAAASASASASAAASASASASASAAAAAPAGSLSIELEAVVSCTSDGLVVVLRKARPPIPPAHPPLVSFDYGDGLFAAPWGQHPIRPQFSQEDLHSFQPPLLPQYMPLRENVKDAGGPPIDVLMGSIRDVAVFAWGVVGINPAMAAYGRGLPSGDARPVNGTSQSHRPATRATEASGVTGNTSANHTTNHATTTPAGSPYSSYPTASDRGKVCETTAFASAIPPAEMYTARTPLPPASCDAYERQGGQSWPRSGQFSHRHQYAEAYGPQPLLPSPVSPTGFAAPGPSQRRLPSLSRDPVYQSVGFASPSPVAQSPTTNAGPFRGHTYAWH